MDSLSTRPGRTDTSSDGGEHDRRGEDPAEARPAESAGEALADLRRGKASWTPLALFGGTALLIGAVAGLLTLVLLLVYFA